MNTFETLVGYRSLSPSLSPPEPSVIEHLPASELRRLACDEFDAALAERLRSSGEWHWKLEVPEVAEQVADELSCGDAERYALLRAAVLEHYADHYRPPTEQEWRSYLRGRRGVRAGQEAPHSRGERIGESIALYYLDDRITDRDPHDQGCPCNLCDKVTFVALGVSFYRLDLAGLQAYRDMLMGADDTSFPDWCNEQESQATIYGPNETLAVENALRFAEKEGWLAVNYAERCPLLAPLVEALGMLVGEDGDLTRLGECKCERVRLLGEELCPVCFASLVFDVFTHR
jgi:hypothetical protein